MINKSFPNKREREREREREMQRSAANMAMMEAYCDSAENKVLSITPSDYFDMI